MLRSNASRRSFLFSLLGFCAFPLLAVALDTTIPAPWNEIFVQKYGEWKLVRVTLAKNAIDLRGRPRSDLLMLYYEKGPRRQIAVSARRYPSAAEAENMKNEEVALWNQKDTTGEGVQNLKVMKQGAVKKGAHLGTFVILKEIKKSDSFQEPLHAHFGPYYVHGYSAVRDFRADLIFLSDGKQGPDPRGAQPTWEEVKYDDWKKVRSGITSEFTDAFLAAP